MVATPAQLESQALKEKLMSMTKEEKCQLFGISMERLNEQYAANAAQLYKMYRKAFESGKKVNGYTADQLCESWQKFLALSRD